MKRALLLLAVAAISAVEVGCGRSESPTKSSTAAGDRSVVVYSSADKEFAELILERSPPMMFLLFSDVSSHCGHH